MVDFFNHINLLLDKEKFDEAKELISKTLEQNNDLEEKSKLFLKTQMNGFLIDIGCESKNEEDLKNAINFLETNEKELENIITKSSYYYNLANAKHGLGKIFLFKNKTVHSIYTTREKLQEHINLYWLAYKKTNIDEDTLKNQILINLSNSLVEVSRIVEALQFLDIILMDNPKFPQALVSRADHLNYLSKVTNCSVTIALFIQIWKSYNEAILTKRLPTTILKRCEINKQDEIKKIQSKGFKLDDIDEEVIKTSLEYEKHTDFRKFSIDNFLTLNEHGIYCNCIAVEKDNIQIGVPHGVFNTKLVPKLELLLNRIKSEFSFARWMYYKSNIEEPFDYDVKFSELLDGEIINSQSELLRTSFRICYGILDKIALGICKLYNVNNKKIYFETFWDDKKTIEKIKNIKNIHLNALYSIACDLNTQTGELKHFKNWRNKLEHNLLILKDKNNFTHDVLNIFEDKEFIAVVDINDFNEKTLHLLQLTRAAIYSFVFCARLETIENKPKDENTSFFDIRYRE